MYGIGWGEQIWLYRFEMHTSIEPRSYSSRLIENIGNAVFIVIFQVVFFQGTINYISDLLLSKIHSGKVVLQQEQLIAFTGDVAKLSFFKEAIIHLFPYLE